jgi:protein O-mannosyl-transferase
VAETFAERRFDLLRGAILLAALAAFAPTLDGPFLFDDVSLANDPAVVDADGPLQLLRPERTRPLTYLTFWVNHRLSGFEPLGWHAANLAIFAATIWVVGGVYRRLAGARAAALALAVFALHPLQAEPVAYVFARATLLAGLICALAWRAWAAERRWTAVAWFAIAMLAKEEAAALPLFLAGAEWFHRRRREGWRALAGPLAAMLALAAAFAARTLYAARETPGAGALVDLGEVGPWSYLLTQGRAAWLYLRLFVAPVGQNFDYDFPFTASLDTSTAAAWAGLLAGLGAVAWLARKHPNAWWILGAAVLALPTSSVAPLADLVAERRMFLPLMSLSLAAGAGLATLVRGWAAWAPGLALALVLGGLGRRRAAVFASDETLWRDTAAKSPNKPRPLLQLARSLESRDQAAAAERETLLERAIRLDPHSLEVLAEIGVYRLRSGDSAGALAAFDRALELDPTDAQAHANRGAALLLLGRPGEADAAFENALVLDPCNYDARNNRILLLRSVGDLDAVRALAEAPVRCRFTAAQRQALAAAVVR